MIHERMDKRKDFEIRLENCRFFHLFDIFEGTLIKMQNVFVTEMTICNVIVHSILLLRIVVEWD